MPSHVRPQLGLPVQLRLYYGDWLVEGWYVFDEFQEPLDGGTVVMRFTKLNIADLE